MIRLCFEVSGRGYFVNMMQHLMSFNSSHQLNSTITNNDCLMMPIAVDWWLYTRTLFIPVVFMLIFQVRLLSLFYISFIIVESLFGFVMQRARIFIAAYFFRRRGKSRIINLYNRLMHARTLLRRSARAHIRLQLKKRTFIVEHTAYVL